MVAAGSVGSVFCPARIVASGSLGSVVMTVVGCSPGMGTGGCTTVAAVCSVAATSATCCVVAPAGVAAVAAAPAVAVAANGRPHFTQKLVPSFRGVPHLGQNLSGLLLIVVPLNSPR